MTSRRFVGGGSVLPGASFGPNLKEFLKLRPQLASRGEVFRTATALSPAVTFAAFVTAVNLPRVGRGPSARRCPSLAAPRLARTPSGLDAAWVCGRLVNRCCSGTCRRTGD